MTSSQHSNSDIYTLIASGSKVQTEQLRDCYDCCEFHTLQLSSLIQHLQMISMGPPIGRRSLRNARRQCKDRMSQGTRLHRYLHLCHYGKLCVCMSVCPSEKCSVFEQRQLEFTISQEILPLHQEALHFRNERDLLKHLSS